MCHVGPASLMQQSFPVTTMSRDIPIVELLTLVPSNFRPMRFGAYPPSPYESMAAKLVLGDHSRCCTLCHNPHYSICISDYREDEWLGMALIVYVFFLSLTFGTGEILNFR